MAIQILGLRDYFDKKENRLKKKEEFYSKEWRAESVPYLFKNIKDIIEDIPKEERYNLYYTASRCIEQRGRKLESQNIIPFDIDDIDESRIEDYISVVLNSLGVKREETGIVFSGNGLQFLIGTTHVIDSPDYFEEHRIFYKGICGAITQDLFKNGLTGVVDPVVFSAGRLLRLPETLNIKPKKGEKKATLIQGHIALIDYDIVARSNIPVVPYNEQISDTILAKFPPPDTEGVLNGCLFIKHCKEHSQTLSEPEWYAVLNLVGRLENGYDIAHEFSKNYDGYNQHATDAKLEQSLTASGARTCLNIHSIFNDCIKCEHWGKCKTPLQIQSKGYIKTKDTGFYNISLDKSGVPAKGKPNYDDLMKHFEQTHSFVTMAEGNINYIYTGTHWEDYALRRIDAFAEANFDPKPNNQMCNEFRGKLQRNNIRNPEWFNTEGFINFANGVLNLESMELCVHTQDQGFRYVLPFNYDPSADCPRFSTFIQEITRGDPELQQVLLEFMGYSLSGIDPAIGQKALILSGEGRNGKSVFMDVLKYLGGKGNYCTLSMGNEINKLENRYQLDGKLFNISEETPSNAMMDSSVFKALVTGGELQARKLYCDAYSMKNRAKIILACNRLPSTKDLSVGMFRRLIIVPFNAKFEEGIEGYDPLIREKLYAESAGIFNLVLKALLKFQRRKLFTSSATIKKAVENYQRDNDTVMLWWEENIVRDDSSETTVTDMYNNYKIDIEEGGQRPDSKVWFGRQLRKYVDNEELFTRKRINGRLYSVLNGYKIATEQGDF